VYVGQYMSLFRDIRLCIKYTRTFVLAEYHLLLQQIRPYVTSDLRNIWILVQAFIWSKYSFQDLP
jgi:hypothetical protein